MGLVLTSMECLYSFGKALIWVDQGALWRRLPRGGGVSSEKYLNDPSRRQVKACLALVYLAKRKRDIPFDPAIEGRLAYITYFGKFLRCTIMGKHLMTERFIVDHLDASFKRELVFLF